MTAMLRVIAVAVAIAALADPVFTLRRSQPLPVDVRVPGPGSPLLEESLALRARLINGLGESVTMARGGAPAAVVLIGDAAPDDLPAETPVSGVTLLRAGAPNVRIIEVAAPETLVAGQIAVVTARLDAVGVRGRSTTVVLEQHGVAGNSATHTWQQDRERATVALPFMPPRPGVYQLRLVARVLDSEQPAKDEVADTSLSVAARPLRVLAYEARPSWSTAFVRRALENDPAFDVASLVTFSRGLQARAGIPPSALTAASLEAYDAVLVGAPEALSAADVSALDGFARVRGGVVVLLPDRAPAGPYRGLVPAAGFEEALLDTPAKLDAGRVSPSASEFALLRQPGDGVVTLATLRRRNLEAPVIAAWPRGAGRVLFSGALDSWRYRARDDAAYARFWTATIAGFAASAPPPIRLTLQPAVGPPRARVTVRVMVRPTEYDVGGDAVVIPAVTAVLIDERGYERPVRVWPTAETGAFEGTTEMPATGRYTVRASVTGTSTETTLVVKDGVQAAAGEDERLRTVASVTGGVFVSGDDLGALERHLEGIPRPMIRVPVRPTRSIWWFSAFVALLCAEWTIRRTRGQR